MRVVFAREVLSKRGDKLTGSEVSLGHFEWIKLRPELFGNLCPEFLTHMGLNIKSTQIGLIHQLESVHITRTLLQATQHVIWH